MVAVVYSPEQLPWVEFIESDDLFLQDEPQAIWFDVLRKLDYRPLQGTAARYYEQLWQFNQQQTEERIGRREKPPAANPETPSQATARLLFGREARTSQRHSQPAQAPAIRPDHDALWFAGRSRVGPRRRQPPRRYDPGGVAAILDDLNIEVFAPLNPRRRGLIRDGLPRGLDHLTPRGVPVCRAGYPFELLGVRHDTKHFLFAAPKDELGQSVCQGCDSREGCYRGQSGGRQVTTPQSRLRWLDPECPQLSKRFLKAMARRTSIERLHKLMKWDLGDEQLTKRGKDAFQARRDKTLLAMHVLLAHDD